MKILSIILIAVSLSMDTFSLALSVGTSLTKRKDILFFLGTGTCDNASLLYDFINEFIDSVEVQKLEHVTIRQTGCMGFCYVEPTVEVKVPGMPDTIYGKVDAAVAGKIVTEHILGKKLVEGHIFDRPAPDIMKK